MNSFIVENSFHKGRFMESNSRKQYR